MPNVSSPTGNFLAIAAHTIDIQFLFTGCHGGNLGVNLDQATGQPRELNASESNLSDQLVAAWTNFASTGNPNAPGDLVWPVFTTGSPVFLSQNIPSSSPYTAAQFYIDHKCDFWYPILGYPTPKLLTQLKSGGPSCRRLPPLATNDLSISSCVHALVLAAIMRPDGKFICGPQPNCWAYVGF